MGIALLICDDSKMARKQVARSLPAEWEVDISYATNGSEALVLIKEGKAEIMFLDLTMPVMDGYQVLEQIRKEDLNTMVIVISGDIQPDARDRVLRLGAMEFIKKPVDSDKILEVLSKFGLIV